MRKLHLLILLASFPLGNVLGQQQAMFTQYMFNGLAVNPAYAGSQDEISFTTLARRQWTAMEGAPTTETFSVHGPIRNRKIAIGLQLFHDAIGITNQYGVYGAYAYRVKMPQGTLSAGAQVGFNSYRARYSAVSLKTSDDPRFSADEAGGILPNFGVGLYYQTQRFYAGGSSPLLITNSLPGGRESQAKQYRHWFFTTGVVVELSHHWKLKPSTLVKVVEGAPLEVDINANVLIRELIWLGISYRSFDALSFLVEWQITRPLRVGYAYDYTLTSLRSEHSGTHEIMLNYRLWFDQSETVSPRYF